MESIINDVMRNPDISLGAKGLYMSLVLLGADEADKATGGKILDRQGYLEELIKQKLVLFVRTQKENKTGEWRAVING